MREDPEHASFIAGRVADRAGLGAVESPWLRLIAVLVVVLGVDLLLGLGGASGGVARGRGGASSGATDDRREVRATLAELSEAAAAGRPAFLLVGDSVLAGDAMADTIPAWRTQRVLDHARRELADHSDAALGQVALDGVLLVDAVHVLAELDRLDPGAQVELVVELNLRQFSAAYADQTGCARPLLCELGRGALAEGRGERAGLTLVEAGTLAFDWLADRAPIHRRRSSLERFELDAVEGLAVARAGAGAGQRGEAREAGEAIEQQRRAQGLARVREHYRSSSLDGAHAQVQALDALLDRLAARGRRATLFLTPLEDEFARASLPANSLARRHEQLARLVHDHRASAAGLVGLLDLDHPLFEAHHFLDHVHLQPEGNRLLALNLLHELGLPLARRPFDWMMIHGEDHDRTLIHRRGVGYADGGPWEALLHEPDGVDVSRDGRRVVIADTGNHVLRQLRGNMQVLERLAGRPRKAGSSDGPALDGAWLRSPRSPQIVGESVYFVDGEDSERVRVVLPDHRVSTLDLDGPRCKTIDVLESGRLAGRDWLYLLCHDDRILAVELAAGRSTKISDPRAPILSAAQTGAIRRYTTIEATDDGRLLFADGGGRIWELPLREDGRSGPPRVVFANDGEELIPGEFRDTYPFEFSEMRVERIVDMEWVERYGALLIQDQHALRRPTERLQRAQTERVHLRLLDLRSQLILPWIKAVPHGEAFHMWNERTENFVSYFHIGAMAVAQDDASLVWVERRRSRVLRLADGLLGLQKSGNLHTTHGIIHMLNPVGTQSSTYVGQNFRPDRHLDTRHEPLERRGPYVALLVGSSLSTVSDRLGNYSLGRRLELELQAELGYRDNIRLDLFQRSAGAASLRYTVGMIETFMSGGGPPVDVLFIELNDFNRQFFRGSKTQASRRKSLGEIEALAARYGTLVIFYDNTAIDANGGDGLRATGADLRELIADARKLGFTVLEPSHELLRELLRESPWSNQPWKSGAHHGSPWAIDLSARALAAMSADQIRAFLREREPARLSEREPESFAAEDVGAPLSQALSRTEPLLDPERLVDAPASHVRPIYASGELRIFVDLAGFDELRAEAGDAQLEDLALAVIHGVCVGEVYGELATQLRVELVEFTSYDEYGEGVRDSARVAWARSFDADSLEQFIRDWAARQAGPGRGRSP